MIAFLVTVHAAVVLTLLESTREDLAATAFERLFRERGLPDAIRSDTEFPSLAQTRCSISLSSPSGG
jgi:hypothetical protein